MSRVFAASDLHVDYQENRMLVSRWSSQDYQKDVLIVAGDITDDLELLERTLVELCDKFLYVFFLPGNHELWLRKQTHADSIQKYHSILEMCDRIGVFTGPRKIVTREINSDTDGVWIIPLHSWYSTPEDDPDNSLFCLPSSGKDNAAHQEEIWMDTELCKWPLRMGGKSKAGYFAHLNKSAVSDIYDAPVISFSHFVPCEALIHVTEQDVQIVDKERNRLGLAKFNGKFQGAPSEFNFTRFAGSDHLGRQVSRLKSIVHVYGHQHRNRDRIIKNTRYISHCLGSPKDRKEGWTWGWHQYNNGPKLITL